MKKILKILFIVLLTSLIISHAHATLTNIPMTFGNWVNQTGGDWYETPEGVQMHSRGYRMSEALTSKNVYSAAGAEFFLKWKVHGTSFSSNRFSLGNFDQDWVYLSEQIAFSTNHSYNGSTVIQSDTWYFTRIKIETDGTYIHVTASGNYDTEQGTVIKTGSGTTTLDLNRIQIYGTLGDPYDGTDAYMVIGEAKTDATVAGTSAAVSVGFGWVFSENRQYSGQFPIHGHPVWGPVDESGNGNAYHFMVVAGEILRSEAYPIPTIELSTTQGTSPLGTDPYDIPYVGNSGGLQTGMATGFLNPPFAPHGVPDAWEGNQYSFTLYSDDTRQMVSDTYVFDATSIDYRQLTIPVATVSPGSDPFHPTISWAPVAGATEYQVLVLNINCKDGMPILNNPLYIASAIPNTTTSLTIPQDVHLFTDKPYAIWVQAREKANGSMINRSSYFTVYSAFKDGLPPDDLQSSNGWSGYKDPGDAPITFAAQANQLDISASAPTEGDDFFGKWQRSVPDLRGLMATYTVSGASGGSIVGIRKNVAELTNGNILRAELRLGFDDGASYVKYRVREYQKETWNEIRQVADGSIGSGWSMGNEYTLGLVLIDDMIYFFSWGLNFCPYITVPIVGDFQPISSRAELITMAYRDPGKPASSLTASVKDVKLILSDHTPFHDTEFNCDVNEDGTIGLEEAIRALQIVSGVRSD